MSTLIDSLAPRDQLPADRRFYPRVAPRTPLPLSFGDQNIGTILNLSENGFLVSTPAALDLNSVHRVLLQLDHAHPPISVYLHTVWSEPAWQKSGMQFLDLRESDRSVLRAWSAQQLTAPSQTSAAAPVVPTSACIEAQRGCAALLPLKAEPSAQASSIQKDLTPPRRGQWLTALEHHRRVPVRYFWSSFAATLFLGATWAAVEGFLPNKILKTPAAHLRSARHPTDSTPSSASGSPAAATSPKPATPSPSIAPTARTSSRNSDVSTESTRTTASDESVVPPRSAPRSQPLRSRAAVLPTQKKVPTAPQLSASASTPQSPAKPAVSPALPNTSTVASAPSNPTSVVSNSYPPPLNPQPLAPNPAAAAQPRTDKAMRQPVDTPQRAAARTVVPNAPVPLRAVPPPADSLQILEIPSMAASAYVQLPGERVVRSPNLTIHIQRSVWVKAGRWFWRSRKKVDLGELATRVDPQMPRFAPGYGKPEYGSITVLATVGKDGQISSVRPLYGSAQLLPGVSSALRSWRYQPTYVDDQPAETLARIEVDFHRPDRYSR